jgi:hypothetical protein
MRQIQHLVNMALSGGQYGILWPDEMSHSTIPTHISMYFMNDLYSGIILTI